MSIKVLIVDDDPGVRSVLERFLSGRGYAVDTANDGETALALIRESAPDLLLLDIYLPGMSGIDVLYNLEHEGLGVPTLTFSGMPDDQMARESTLLGASDFILKPFGLADLDSTLMAKLAGMGLADPS